MEFLSEFYSFFESIADFWARGLGSADFWDFFGEISVDFWKKLKISPEKSQKSAENWNIRKRLHRILCTDGMKV